MTALLTIPPRATGVKLYLAFGEFLNAYPDMPTEVEIDFNRLKFIEPPCIAFLANFTRWFRNMGTAVEFVGMDAGRDVIKYLDDSLFFEQQLGHKLNPASKCRDTTLPLKNLTQTDSHAWLEFVFIPWLSDKSGLSVASLAEVRSSIKEVINNINDHTEYDEGYVFAQWFPKMAEIKISIADFGCGIKDTVRRELPGCNDAEAIHWACLDGTSSKSLPSNRGAGLYHLLLNIVLNFNGVVYVTSQTGRVQGACSLKIVKESSIVEISPAPVGKALVTASGPQLT